MTHSIVLWGHHSSNCPLSRCGKSSQIWLKYEGHWALDFEWRVTSKTSVINTILWIGIARKWMVLFHSEMYQFLLDWSLGAERWGHLWVAAGCDDLDWSAGRTQKEAVVLDWVEWMSEQAGIQMPPPNLASLKRWATHDIVDSYRRLRKHFVLNTSVAVSIPGGGSVSFLTVLQTAVVEYTGTVWSDPHTIGSLSWWLYSCSPGLTSMWLQLISEKIKCDCIIIQVIWVFK